MALDRSAPACRELLGEAAAAGFVEPAGTAFRFVHALVRDAVVAGLPGAERVRLQAAVARAIERVHADDLDAHLPELARHWLAAGDAEQASRWSERAADAAARSLGYEEAARLYRQALDVSDGMPDDRRHRLRLALGQSHYQAGALDEAWSAYGAAGAAARRRGRSDLLAETALAIECTSVVDWDRRVRDVCADALAGLPEPSAVRARVLARLAEAQLWMGELDDARANSAAAVAVAEESGDGQALLDALRARQLACTGPDGLDERGALAERLVTLGAEPADPTAELCGHRGRIDVLLARGDLDSAAAALERLSWLTRRGHGPTADWYLHRYRAVLAQARGDFATARDAADAGLAAVAPLRHPAAFPVRMSLLVGIDHHLGADPSAEHVLACRNTRPGGDATPGHAYLIMDFLCPAAVVVQAGLVEEAAAKFRALGPVSSWSLPEEHRLTLWSFAVLVGTAIDARAQVDAARQRLARYRGQHVVDSAHVTLYLGPVELYLGKAARHLGELDVAVTELETARRACVASGARGFAVEAGHELAAALAARGGPTDGVHAATLIGECRTSAEDLGMRPYVKVLDDLADELAARARPSLLSARELEVAALVARGHTNARVAQELFISPRTVETHVQHILVKLGLRNRSQVAVWFSEYEARFRIPGR
jgi:DNA-binding CsgD family transcriptional regulator/tetratricopeptide (TPR) repeat protein